MFKQNIDHSRTGKLSPFGHGYQRNDGYQNIDSPMKAAFRQQAQSPKYKLSPIKLNREGGRMNRSRSPILLSKREDNNFMSGNKNLSPFRKMDYRQSVINNEERHSFYNNQQQQEHSFQNTAKNISFTNLIRKTSNTCQSPHNFPLISPMEHSTSTVNYLQSDRNFREDTNLFKKLANMLESNKSNQNQNKSFVTSGISQNSVNYKALPQSCKNAATNYGSNKKVMFKNILTIQSIQSPEDYQNEGKNYEDGVETRCYSEYEKMTAQYLIVEKKQPNRMDETKIQRKFSQPTKCSNDNEMLFRKASIENQNLMQNQQQSKPIDFDLTNSFGAGALKNQMIIESKKQVINPFELISSQVHSQQQQQESQQSITQSLSQSQDSVFASLHMLLQKVDDKEANAQSPQQNQSINLSILSQNSMGELDMEPFIQKR